MNGLVTLGILLIGLVVLFWPRIGLAPRYVHFCRLARKERLENALKHVHHCEYSKIPATLEGLAGSLRISRHKATELASNLEATGLITTVGAHLQLTDVGRNEALRVIRIHRLWEQYLAEFSGLHEALWHDHADRAEHTTTQEETERIAGQLGNPRFDPHGAPIPTLEGDLPTSRGEPLTNLPSDQWAKIVHIEDEPRSTYEKLVALGLAVGVTVRVTGHSTEAITMEVGGEETTLAPIVAGNLSVERISPVENTSSHLNNLARLAPGERGRVIGLRPSCRGIQRRRLLDLGLVPGTIVEAEFVGSAGDPTAYRIRSALIALRRNQAQLVQVEKIQEI